MQRAQSAQGSTRPKLLQALIDAWRQPDVRQKIVFTLAMLVVFRFLAHIPVPEVNPDQLDNAFDNNPVLGFLNLFSGGGLENLSIVALGVYPYITASIVMNLLTPMVPKLQELSREGESGRNKIQVYTYWFAVPMSIVQGYGQLLLLENANAISGIGFTGADLLPTVSAVITLTAGTLFLIWLGELITEKGIGNGISLLIFGGIVASFPTLFNQVRQSDTGMAGIVAIIVVAVVLIFLIVLFQEAQRRIPVQYARSQFRGGRMYRQSGQSYIPLRVNSAGMIPLIFAFSIIIFPSVMAGWISGAGTDVNTVSAVEVPFDIEDPSDQPLSELQAAGFYEGLDAEGSFRVNEAEISYIAAEDSFDDVVRRVNRDADANVLTTINSELDVSTGEFVPTWTIERNDSGQR